MHLQRTTKAAESLGQTAIIPSHRLRQDGPPMIHLCQTGLGYFCKTWEPPSQDDSLERWPARADSTTAHRSAICMCWFSGSIIVVMRSILDSKRDFFACGNSREEASSWFRAGRKGDTRYYCPEPPQKKRGGVGPFSEVEGHPEREKNPRQIERWASVTFHYFSGPEIRSGSV